MKTEIQQKLEKIAYEKTFPFCYSDYTECPSGRCSKCGSDDLQRLYRGIGNDWGVDWVIKEILSEDLTEVDCGQVFEDCMREVYPETTTIGFISYDTVSAMKELDPIAWELAQSEYIDSLESDEQIMSFDNGSTYYWIHDLEAIGRGL